VRDGREEERRVEVSRQGKIGERGIEDRMVEKKKER
jgi:hypothetical protein